MQSTESPHQGESNEYSGHCEPGLTTEATYDRMLYYDHGQLYDLDGVIERFRDIHHTFETSERSRLVMRLLLDPAVTSSQLGELYRLSGDLELDMYPDQGTRFNYLTISLNRADRSLPGDIYQNIISQVQHRIHRVNSERGGFQSRSLQVLQRAREEELSITLSVDPEEISSIWEPFGWSREAVAAVLAPGSNDVIMGIRDPGGQLLGASFYSDQSHGEVRHGESTEWTVSPENRRHGIIQPLLLVFHAHLLQQGIQNIWADLRTPDPVRALPNSISPALRSGMDIFRTADHRYLSSNHVAIEGEAQSYNANSMESFGDTPAGDLRSFVRGWVNSSLFDNQLRDACQRML